MATMTDCPRCEAQGATITKLARELAEARIALAQIRDVADSENTGLACREIRRIASSCLPIDVDPRP